MTTKNEKANIIEMNFTAPMMVGGVLITEQVIKELRYIQTGTHWAGETKLNNNGYADLKEYINDLTYLLLDYMTTEGSDTKTGRKIIVQIESVCFLRSMIESFKLPDELLTA